MGRAIERRCVCLVNGNHDINVGAWSPFSSYRKPPSLGLPRAFPPPAPVLSPPLPRPPHPCGGGEKGGKAVLTQAHILPGRAGGHQGQDHRQQPERSGLHGHGRALGTQPSEDVLSRPGRLLYTHPGVCTGTLSLFVWGGPLPARWPRLPVPGPDGETPRGSAP